MTEFHFKYSGECVVSADTYEDAEKEVSRNLRGIYSYHRIHHSVGMLATCYYDIELDDD